MSAELLFLVGLAAGAVVLGGLLISIGWPAYRFWPHGERDWTFWVGWVSWLLYYASFFGVAYLDMGNLYAVDLVTLGVGASLFVVGVIVSGVAARQLGLHRSSGLRSELYTGGLYRYSRNPQYVGVIVATTGVVVLSGSLYTAVLAVIGVAWFLIAPAAEEPWLHEEYGEAYDRYREEVPRFVGRSSLSK